MSTTTPVPNSAMSRICDRLGETCARYERTAALGSTKGWEPMNFLWPPAVPLLGATSIKGRESDEDLRPLELAPRDMSKWDVILVSRTAMLPDDPNTTYPIPLEANELKELIYEEERHCEGLALRVVVAPEIRVAGLGEWLVRDPNAAADFVVEELCRDDLRDE